jgi:hypothetical protein
MHLMVGIFSRGRNNIIGFICKANQLDDGGRYFSASYNIRECLRNVARVEGFVKRVRQPHFI